METFSALLALCAGNSPVTGEFPAQRPVTRSFDVFFDLRLNKRLSKQWWGWWFEAPLRQLWRHRNGVPYNNFIKSAMWSWITGVSIVCSIDGSGTDERKHQSSASLAFCGGNSPTGEFPTQKDSNAENVSIWWRHHVAVAWWNRMTTPWDENIFDNTGPLCGENNGHQLTRLTKD